MPRAILHVGTMKTGTTSIQASLAKNPSVLARNGYSYLGPPMRHSSVLGPALADMTDKSQDLIISDEGLWHFTDTKRSDTPELARLLRGYDVTVLIYLRRPDSFMDSWFQQGLKNGTGSLTMTRFLESPLVKEGLQFQERISRFESVFHKAKIILRAYEKDQLVDGDAVRDFLHCVGLPADDFSIPEWANATPNTDSLLLRSLFQHTIPRGGKLTRELDKLDQHLRCHGYKGRRYSLLTPEELEKIITTYRPVFSRLHKKYGNGASPDFFLSWPDPANVNVDDLDLRWTQEEILNMSGGAGNMNRFQRLIKRVFRLGNPATNTGVSRLR